MSGGPPDPRPRLLGRPPEALWLVGIDDTDVAGSPGTNQLARAILRRLAPRFRPLLAVRHQLLSDPRVPSTSKNSAAALVLVNDGSCTAAELAGAIRSIMRARFVPGSDPGLCVAARVPLEITEFGRRCQRDLVRQQEARRGAACYGILLEGLGGTEDGVIGALAAVGLAAGGDDGRVVHIGPWPDDLAGVQGVERLYARGIDAILREPTGERIVQGQVDVGKHLRPNLRGGRVVLFVQPCPAKSGPSPQWRAVRRP